MRLQPVTGTALEPEPSAQTMLAEIVPPLPPLGQLTAAGAVERAPMIVENETMALPMFVRSTASPVKPYIIALTSCSVAVAVAAMPYVQS